MTASPTPPDAQVGLPSEEIRRIIDDALNSAIPEPWEVSAHATQRILDLIRPAFEAKEREIERLRDIRDRRGAKIIDLSDRALSAEAKLAQAVEDEREACAAIARQVHGEACNDPSFVFGWEAAANTIRHRIRLRPNARSAAAMGEKR